MLKKDQTFFKQGLTFFVGDRAEKKETVKKAEPAKKAEQIKLEIPEAKKTVAKSHQQTTKTKLIK